MRNSTLLFRTIYLGIASLDILTKILNKILHFIGWRTESDGDGGESD